MNSLIFGNILAFIGSAIMVAIGLVKNRNKIILAQCAQFAFQGTANLVLGGTSGGIATLLSILRNLICIKWKLNVPLKVVFSVIVAVPCLMSFNGILSLFPLISAIAFTWLLDVKSAVLLKTVIISTSCLWLIYDFSIKNYVAAAFDAFTIVSNTVGIFMVRKNGEQ
ncbi:MAG: YgjV family protein [Clostridia bacterium]|nr:YgjV family protein [Clostridia bacterium]